MNRIIGHARRAIFLSLFIGILAHIPRGVLPSIRWSFNQLPTSTSPSLVCAGKPSSPVNCDRMGTGTFNALTRG